MHDKKVLSTHHLKVGHTTALHDWFTRRADNRILFISSYSCLIPPLIFLFLFHHPKILLFYFLFSSLFFIVFSSFLLVLPVSVSFQLVSVSFLLASVFNSSVPPNIERVSDVPVLSRSRYEYYYLPVISKIFKGKQYNLTFLILYICIIFHFSLHSEDFFHN